MMSPTRRMTRWMVPAGVLLTLGVFALADTTWAQPPGGPGPRAGRMRQRRPGPPVGIAGLPRADLSEAQREQIQALLEQHRDATRAAEERVRTARRALQDAVTADMVNEGAIRAVASELGMAEGEAAVQRATVHADVWQVLTPEQQVAARAAEAERQQRMEQRGQRMGERRERRQERRPQG